jgi:N-acetyl-anhydromuramyl-L-alanine amidase AmpD
MAFSQIREITSTYFNLRPKGTKIDTIVIHSMYHPKSQNPFDILECFNLLNQHEVSAHYAIARDGITYSFVPPKFRAWHAGQSKMPFSRDKRENVNNFSIGIEMIGDKYQSFTDEQYKSLVSLLELLFNKFPICAIVSHRVIAPGRKEDPGDNFNWDWLKTLSKKNLKIKF